MRRGAAEISAPLGVRVVGVGAGIDQKVFIVDREPERQRICVAMRGRTSQAKRAKIHQQTYTAVVRAHAGQSGIRELFAWRGRRVHPAIEVSEQVRNERSRSLRGRTAETQPVRLSEKQARQLHRNFERGVFFRQHKPACIIGIAIPRQISSTTWPRYRESQPSRATAPHMPH